MFALTIRGGIRVCCVLFRLLIKEDSEGLTMTWDGKHAQLSIPETMVEDEGTYSCFATNALGQVVTTARLFINGQSRSSSLILLGYHPYHLQWSIMGYDPYHLQWSIMGYDPYHLQWSIMVVCVIADQD